MCCVVFCYEQVVIKEKVLELLLYFTNHEDEEVKCKAIIGLGKNDMSYNTSYCFFCQNISTILVFL